MTEVLYSYSRAWTLLEHGDPEMVADLATSEAVAQAQQKVTRRERSSVRSRMEDLARLQDEVGAESCFALCSTTPRVQMIAYTLVHSSPGAHLVDEFVESALASRPSGLGDADVSRHQLAVGEATRILTRERIGEGRKSSLQTIVRWIIRIDSHGHDLAVAQSSFIPDELYLPIALPMIDRLVQDVSAR